MKIYQLQNPPRATTQTTKLVPFQQSYLQSHHQTPLVCNITNEHLGDQPILNQLETNHHLCAILHNVNSVSNVSTNLSWQAITQAALDMEADIVCIQETNTNWTTPTLHNAGQIINQSTYHASKISVSASNTSTTKRTSNTKDY